MITTTTAAGRARPAGLGDVSSRRALAQRGVTPSQIRAQLAAGRWQLAGRAVVLHNGPLTTEQRSRVALIHCGPRAALTCFTALAAWGLQHWPRDEVHVLVPGGARVRPLPGVVVHRTRDWDGADIAARRALHRVAPAAVLAAAAFRSPRPGCGLLAAVVQQRLCTADDLAHALALAPRSRHRAVLIAATGDIGQGAHALSEIDLRALCRRFRLPLPVQQAVRITADGTRRYLDAEWRLPDGRLLAVEVDGAHHLDPRAADRDALRQNDVVLGGTLVLRFTATTVRCAPELVAAQLAAVLLDAPGNRRNVLRPARPAATTA